MGEDDERELAELRARAYGPGPDIGGDPDAVARLQALEDARRPAASVRPAASAGSRTAPAARAGGPLPRVVLAPPRPPLPGARRPIGRRALAIAWAASVVVVGLAVSGATAAAFLAGDARHDAVLRHVAEGRSSTAATAFGLTGDVTTYDDLAGMQILTATPGANICILVQARADPTSRDEVDGDCAPRGLPVTADLVVRSTYPDAVLARYAPGTTIRFTYEGGIVNVDVAGPDPGAEQAS
jgi:hypothetical protein